MHEYPVPFLQPAHLFEGVEYNRQEDNLNDTYLPTLGKGGCPCWVSCLSKQGIPQIPAAVLFNHV